MKIMAVGQEADAIAQALLGLPVARMLGKCSRIEREPVNVSRSPAIGGSLMIGDMLTFVPSGLCD